MVKTLIILGACHRSWIKNYPKV